MINTSANPSPARLRCWGSWEHWNCPSSTVQHYGDVFLAIILFFIAQLLTCAWDQPFWTYEINFPGQIVAMVFVWLFLWAVQLAFFQPGEGMDRLYYRHLRAPVSLYSSERISLPGIIWRLTNGLDTDRNPQQAHVNWVHSSLSESHQPTLRRWQPSRLSNNSVWWVPFHLVPITQIRISCFSVQS